MASLYWIRGQDIDGLGQDCGSSRDTGVITVLSYATNNIPKVQRINVKDLYKTNSLYSH